MLLGFRSIQSTRSHQASSRAIGQRSLCIHQRSKSSQGPPHPISSSEPLSSGLSKEAWKIYVDRASQADEHSFKAWNLQMHNRILFAALFSAVLAAFVLESYQNLQPDPNSASVDLLQQILPTLQSNGRLSHATLNTSSAPGNFQPSSTDVCINALWYASLVISISTAFLAILAKQWIFNLSEDWEPTLVMKGRQRYFLRESRERWKLSSVLSWLPALLHVSLLLFFAGLAIFLQSINTTIAIVGGCLMAITVSIYVATHTISMLDCRSPYKTSVTTALVTAVLSALIELHSVIYTFHARIVTGVGLFHECCCRRRRHRSQSDLDLPRSETDDADTDILIFIRSVSEHAPPQPMGDFSDVRREMKAAFKQLLGRSANPRIWETDYLHRKCDDINAHVLTDLIRQGGDGRLLTKERCHFPSLPRYRRLFIDAGALSLLSHPLSYLPAHNRDRSLPLRPADKAAMLKLTQLLTEADGASLAQVEGVPVGTHVDPRPLPSSVVELIANLRLLATKTRCSSLASCDSYFMPVISSYPPRSVLGRMSFPSFVAYSTGTKNHPISDMIG
ncbi:uncharacterized protein C8Q71DRAFT_250072 [Rhodofomes roseus]|uniref:DUF6535 domain-containing protein n=1 Tax=Rhodofomes roseus TaxID=34475 RepID=A0ABQ8K7D3_9APHY|nr:uncharacterized protein C8Q71DRAFT_250072 [Rhodofomes roseus]KAH9833043.1 hypothetical protein C8Q71DRAFT_250072 [Rhodofomes roseus]